MNAAVLVAAGKGTRMGGGGDKLFLEIAGRPVAAHAWRRFEACPDIHEVVVVIRPELRSAFETLAAREDFKKPFRFVSGGAERQDSVWNGLEAMGPGVELVAIHDAARPCTPPALISQTLQAAREHGAAVAGRRVTDTIKRSRDGEFIQEHPERAELFAVQTPQTFRLEVIRKALRHVREQGVQVTDDTAACQWVGLPVKLVLSDLPNPKVTLPEDLPLIEQLLREA